MLTKNKQIMHIMGAMIAKAVVIIEPKNSNVATKKFPIPPVVKEDTALIDTVPD